MKDGIGNKEKQREDVCNFPLLFEGVHSAGSSYSFVSYFPIFKHCSFSTKYFLGSQELDFKKGILMLLKTGI